MQCFSNHNTLQRQIFSSDRQKLKSSKTYNNIQWVTIPTEIQDLQNTKNNCSNLKLITRLAEYPHDKLRKETERSKVQDYVTYWVFGLIGNCVTVKPWQGCTVSCPSWQRVGGGWDRVLQCLGSWQRVQSGLWSACCSSWMVMEWKL